MTENLSSFLKKPLSGTDRPACPRPPLPSLALAQGCCVAPCRWQRERGARQGLTEDGAQVSLQSLQHDVLDVLHALAQELLAGHGQELLLGHDLHLPVVTEEPEPGWRQADRGPRPRRMVAVPLPSFSGPGGLGGGGGSGGGRGWGLLRPPAGRNTGTHTEKFHLHWQPQALPGPLSWTFGVLPSTQPLQSTLGPSACRSLQKGE